MGFGPLLVGYVSAVLLGYYVGPAMLLGGIFMMFGLLELRKYCPTFLYAIIADALLLVCSVFESASWVKATFAFSIFGDTAALDSAMNIASFVVFFVFNIVLLYGIADLSRRVEYPETRYKAYRNMVYVLMFNFFQLLLFIPNTIFSKDSGFFGTLLIIVHLIVSVTNILLILKCYAMICPEGEEDMHRKTSRFEFINKMRQKQDEREQAAIESTKAYLEKKIEKRNHKQSKKHKKKK